MGKEQLQNNEVLYDPVPIKEEKIKYPKAVFIIVLNEFCERFSYSGMRAFLVLYLKQKLMYTDDEATEIYHGFTTMAYFCAIFGAILADSYIGKFRTILYLMVIYAIGNVLIAVTAIPHFGIPGREFTLISLMMVALGTGGIKPCVSSFGGDQFVLPQQEKELTTFFSILYVILCLASLISKCVSPLLRSKVQCFGDKDCFSLAFGAPGTLIVISIVFFYLAKKVYIIKKPTGNVVAEVAKCICVSIKRRKSAKDENEKSKKTRHWLDYACDSFDQTFIDSVKRALNIFILFTPLPVFWALLDQLGSRWTLQATQMDGDFGYVTLKPDQMQVLCPMCLLFLIPFFKYVIYPFLIRYNLLKNLLHRLIVGCVFAGISYLCTGMLELQLEKTYSVLPSEGNGQLRIFNTFNDCSLHFDNQETGHNFTVSPMQMHVSYMDLERSLNLSYDTTLLCKDYTRTSEEMFELQTHKAVSYVFRNDTQHVWYFDNLAKSRSGLPYIRVITSFSDGLTQYHEVKLVDAHKGNVELNTNSSLSSLIEVFAGEYILFVNDTRVDLNINVKIGGVYTIIVQGNKETKYNANIITITQPNSISMVWILPQIVLISIGEVLFSISGLEFAFKEAPDSMKAVLQAYWLLIEAFGNVLIIIVTRLGSGYRQVYHFFFFAILMFISTVIFYFLMRRYERQRSKDDNSIYNQPFNVELDPNNATVTSQHKYMEVMQIDDTLDH